MQLYFDGHAISPNLTYRVLIGAVRTTGSVDLEEAFVKYAFGEGWHVTVGQMKAPFLREYLISSGNLQTVDRSYISAVYSLHRSQGVQLGYNTDNLRLTAMIHDGGDQINRDFNADFTDIAIAARAEWLVAGKWSQMRDFMSWSDEPTGLLLGAAINAQLGESGAAVTAPDILSYTFDANIQHKGFSAYFAAVGRHLSADGPTNIPSLDEYGIVAQAGYFLVPDKLEAFGRYEFIHFDGRHYSYRTNAYTAVIDDTVNIVTAGVNYYFKRHNAKFSTDIVWVLDALPVNDTGAGLLRSSERDQIVLRSQFQLFF